LTRDPGAPGPSIGDVTERTGLSEATLRMWESRHGFPQPQRLASGHRRYSEQDVELVRHVLEERERGLSLKAAIERVRSAGGEREESLFAGLRRRRPDILPHLLPKRALIALSHAMEDELCARAERGVLIGTFQEARFYRASERRWRELARTADVAVVLADFDEPHRRPDAPVELPLAPDDPVMREWGIVCTTPSYSVCMVGLERPGQRERPDLERRFETIWTVDPDVVDAAARISCELVARTSPRLAGEIGELLDTAPAAGEDRFDVAAAVTSRMVAYLGQGEGPSTRVRHD
jgi:MerR family transcriptional regulator, light-induced transcriptional regulator